jgi:redox-sensing transcriptional repressor
MTNEKTVGRLSMYRRILDQLQAEGVNGVYSHQLAAMAGGTAAQVRRDLMVVGYSGNPKRGYDCRELADSIGRYLDDPAGQRCALAGVGNLGRAVLAYFRGHRPLLSIVAAFDVDATKVGRSFEGCPCHPVDRIPQIVAEQDISVGILAVPADAAQDAADRLVAAGVRGLLNFAPTTLHLSPEIYIADMDMTMGLEKVAFFSRHGAPPPRARRPPNRPGTAPSAKA